MKGFITIYNVGSTFIHEGNTLTFRFGETVLGYIGWGTYSIPFLLDENDLGNPDGFSVQLDYNNTSSGGSLRDLHFEVVLL